MSKNIQKTSYYSVKGPGKIFIPAIKDIDATGRIVTGFFNTFNYFDSDCDILVPGCAKRTIKERGPNSSAVAKIKHAMDHDLTRMPGKIMVLEERTEGGMTGIYFETKMADTTLGNDVLKNYIAGVYDNHSIGFMYMNSEFVDRDSKRWQAVVDLCLNPDDLDEAGFAFIIKEIAMWEGSTLAFGANSLTPFLGVKSAAERDIVKLDLLSRIDRIAEVLKSGTQSDDMMATLDVQLMQIKQIASEIGELTPEIKKIEKKAETPIIPVAEPELDAQKIAEALR